MKKFLLTATLIMGLAASLCACGSKKDDDKTTVETGTATNATTEETTEAVATDTYEYYFSQPEFKSMLDSQLESLVQEYAGTYSDITIEAKGDDLIYNYTYDASINPTDVDKEALETADWSTNIKGVKQSFLGSMSKEPSSITYNFYLNDGTLFFTVSE